MVDEWRQCLEQLQHEITAQHFNTWLRPLQVENHNGRFLVYAPNRFVLDWVNENYLARITDLLSAGATGSPVSIELKIGSAARLQASPVVMSAKEAVPAVQRLADHGSVARVAVPESRLASNRSAESRIQAKFPQVNAPIISVDDPDGFADNYPHGDNRSSRDTTPVSRLESRLEPDYVFERYIEGKSNSLARAAAMQAALHPGSSDYNPLFLYGSTGLGKTHLMHAVGNHILKNKPDARIKYLSASNFLDQMVSAIKSNRMNEFKEEHRMLDVLLLDDIQFFSGKEQTQEEFFHTFNAMMDRRRQMIFTSDRYPKDLVNVQDRLKSRFSWGLTMQVEPPELETRVSILIEKARASGVDLPQEHAFYIAHRIRTNVRDLEGALKKVLLNRSLRGDNSPIDAELVRHSLRDVMNFHDRKVSIPVIQKAVADYFNIRMADLLSQRRLRSIARPRQIAMALSRELTTHSLPEIGNEFGGRDHTTVLHACNQVGKLRKKEDRIRDDYDNLYRTLTI